MFVFFGDFFTCQEFGEKIYSATELASVVAGGCSRGENCKFSHERPAKLQNDTTTMPPFLCVPPKMGVSKNWSFLFFGVENHK